MNPREILVKAENNGEINVFLCQDSSPDNALSLPNDSWLTLSKEEPQQQQQRFHQIQRPALDGGGGSIESLLMMGEKRQRYGGKH